MCTMQWRQYLMDGGDFLDESIYICFAEKKMGENWSIIFYAQLLVFFSLPSIRCWWNDAGEMYMFRKGRLLWTVRDMWTLFGRSSRTCFFYVWSSNTWHILTNGGRKSQKLQQKKVQRSHCSHSPSFLSSSPCAGNYKSWTTRTTNCTFQAVCAVYIESHRYNMMKPGSILICFIEIAVIFLIAATT